VRNSSSPAKEEVLVVQTAIFRFLRHLEFVLKESYLHAAEPDRPYVGAACQHDFEIQTRLDPRRLVFIIDRSGARRVCKVPFGHWKTSAFVAALRGHRRAASQSNLLTLFDPLYNESII
jgi:hypothetical protein